MKKLFLLFSILLAASSCGDHDDDNRPDEPETFQRTVLVYVMGENYLHYFFDDELLEMRQGTMNLGNNAFLVYVDRASEKERPYLIRIKDGLTVDSMSLEADPISTDPAVMKRILDYASTRYPADDYGLVLWGHASGWLFEDSVAANTAGSRRRAFGLDNGSNVPMDKGKWINIPSLASTLAEWGKPLKFIFADCCQFQCIETAYELRHVTDYVIGSPAEIPGEGAPYQTLTPALFGQGERFYEAIVDAYFAQKLDGYQTPLSVVKTSTLDQLALATRTALHAVDAETIASPDMTDRIYYKGSVFSLSESVMYDMKDFMMSCVPEAPLAAWQQALDSTVVYKAFAFSWITNNQVAFTNFKMQENRYGGVSMFVPQDRPGSSYDSYNSDIRKTAWYWAAGLNELGW